MKLNEEEDEEEERRENMKALFKDVARKWFDLPYQCK